VRVADDVMALEVHARAVSAALDEAPTLARWAEARAERVFAGGRGPAWRVELGGAPAVVRHYRRGGWMAPLLGDRYFDRPPRPFAELAVSESLRAAGVPTARVLAAAAYAARPGYRADLVTEWLTPGLDLEELLRPGLYPDSERDAAVETAGRTVGRAHAAGLDHPDLRPRNLFLRPLGPPGVWDAALLDLDRARIVPDDARRIDSKKKTSSAFADRSRRSAARAA
jgi:3-deoxy-D-manno-octulosonic acid kinase